MPHHDGVALTSLVLSYHDRPESGQNPNAIQPQDPYILYEGVSPRSICNAFGYRSEVTHNNHDFRSAIFRHELQRQRETSDLRYLSLNHSDRPRCGTNCFDSQNPQAIAAFQAKPILEGLQFRERLQLPPPSASANVAVSIAKTLAETETKAERGKNNCNTGTGSNPSYREQ